MRGFAGLPVARSATPNPLAQTKRSPFTTDTDRSGKVPDSIRSVMNDSKASMFLGLPACASMNQGMSQNL